MEPEKELILWLKLWMAVIALLVLIRSRRKAAGSGLVLAYLMNFSLLHWFGAFVYILPWYDYKWNALWNRGFTIDWVVDGLKLSAYGVIAFVIGSLFLSPFATAGIRSHRQKEDQTPDPRLPKAQIKIGFLCYFILSPILGKIPSMSSVLSSGLSLMVTGLGLSLWSAWTNGNRRAFRKTLTLGFLGLPLFTLMGQGFMSFGTTAVLALAAFVVSFYRPRWKVFIFGILFVYAGLSSYVTYMRDRGAIRQVIWEKASFSEKFRQLHLTASTFEWLDLHKQTHLMRIDSRLNQNLLVGAAVEHLSETHNYATGETLWQAVVALVPRFIWRDKPKFAGSGGLVSRFTGLKFAEGTSVGIGQVMELYVNFGTTGVILGFLSLGVILSVFDAMTHECLLRGDWQGFTLWFLPGLCLMEILGSFAGITASMAGAVVMAHWVNRWLHRFKAKKNSPTKWGEV